MGKGTEDVCEGVIIMTDYGIQTEESVDIGTRGTEAIIWINGLEAARRYGVVKGLLELR